MDKATRKIMQKIMYRFIKWCFSLLLLLFAMRRNALFLILVFGGLANAVAGTFFPVPIPTNLLNQNIISWTNGSVYSGRMTGSQTFGGVPFTMQTNASGNNVVWGTSTSVFSVSSGTTYSNTVTINTNLYGATKVYTLINSAWGTSGSNVGSLTFKASNGDSYTVNLVEGVNVRDHYYGSFTKTISASYVTLNVLGLSNSGAHLDMQAFTLPSSFQTEVLSSITFRSTGSSATGLPFLAGVTADASSYAIDHLRLTHTGSGLTCTGSSITVTACQDADTNGSCTGNTLGLSGNIYATNPSGTIVATQAFTIPAGSSSTTVTISDANAETDTFSAGNFSITPSSPTALYSCWNSNAGTVSCSHTYSSAGFIFSSTLNGTGTVIPSQTAGTSSNTYYLRAVKSGTTTSACAAALSGSKTVNMAYVCNNPITCSGSNLMRVNGGASTNIQRNNNGSVSGYTGVPLTFDAAGNAPFTFNYSDVGAVTLHASKVVNSTTLIGSSNTFVVKPYSFVISNISRTSDVYANPAASDALGAKFISAGSPFTANVTAVSSAGNATPNFGREIIPEGVTLNQSLVLPSGGSVGSLGGTSVILGSNFTSGIATVSDLTWSEVGIITLTPNLTDNDYLGAGSIVGTTTGNIGRFYPHHFSIVAGATTPACDSSFSYYGQDGFTTGFTLTAQNSANASTQNYTGSFAKLDPTSWSNYNFSAATLPTGSTLSVSSTAPTGTWNNGSATVSAKHILSRPTSLTAPASITISAAPSDSDSVTMTSTAVSAASNFRFGRLFIPNTYGSELLPLSVPIEAQYWNGTSYQRNQLDSCSTIPTSSIAMGNYKNNLAACETTLTGGGTMSAGKTGVKLSAPGNGNNGSVDLTVNLDSASGSTCTPTATSATSANIPWFGTINPSARATFGIFKTPVIYLRENF